MISQYTEYIGEKEFVDIDSKKAYLAACKWLATNVYSKPDYTKHIVTEFQKIQNKKGTKFKFVVKLYCVIDEAEAKRMYCLKCKEMANILYSVNSPKCEECRMFGYKAKLQNELVNMKKFLREGVFGNGED